MIQPTMEIQINECLYGTIVGFLLPFFLKAAGGNEEIARATIVQLIDAHKAANDVEIDVAARIVGFGVASLHNLRLSMGPDLPVAGIIQYRTNAINLSRAALNAQKRPVAVRAKQPVTQAMPGPTVAPPPPAPARVTAAQARAPAPRPTPPSLPSVSNFPADFETMKRNARIMMDTYAKEATLSNTALLSAPNPAAVARAAAAEAVAIARRRTAG